MLPAFIIVGVIVAVVVFLAARKRSVTVVLPPVEIPPTFAFDYARDGEPWLRSNVLVPDEALAAIRDGVALQIERSSAAHPDWVQGNNIEDYTILFINPMAVNVETDPGSPALIVGGIQCAGTCLGVGNDHSANRPVIVLPHQVATNWTHLEYLKQSARNESEHIRLNWCDAAMFAHYQGVNDQHPIFP